MQLKINKKSLDNVLNNVAEVSYMLNDPKDLYNILELEKITNSKSITLGDLYEYESHLKRLKLNFPKKIEEEKEMAYAQDVKTILEDITGVINSIERNTK